MTSNSDRAVAKNQEINRKTGERTNVAGAAEESKPDQAVGDAVSSKLKAFYRSVEEEPIPRRLLDLLDGLDDGDKDNSDS